MLFEKLLTATLFLAPTLLSQTPLTETQAMILRSCRGDIQICRQRAATLAPLEEPKKKTPREEMIFAWQECRDAIKHIGLPKEKPKNVASLLTKGDSIFQTKNSMAMYDAKEIGLFNEFADSAMQEISAIPGAPKKKVGKVGDAINRLREKIPMVNVDYWKKQQK